MSVFEGTVEDIIFRNDDNGWTVASFKMNRSTALSAVGFMPFLSKGERIRITGELVEHKDYGQQIRVDSYEALRPEGRSAVEKYLASGILRGVGPATAKQIVKHFGDETMDVLEHAPERLREISGIGAKRAAMISESFMEHNAMQSTIMLLQGAGISANLAAKVFRTYGVNCETILRTNPYRLADEIDGIGFTTADRIALSQGFTAGDPARLRSGVRYVLNESVNRMGHMYLPFADLVAQATDILGVDGDTAEETVRALIGERQLSCEEIDDVQAVYLPGHYQTECAVANKLVKLSRSGSFIRVEGAEAGREISDYESRQGVSLSPQQREAVLAAVTGGLTVITGGPGTGKTTSINCILSILSQRGSVELAAPTGRAAKRMSEATGQEARTLHRLLEYGGDGIGFQRNEDEPLDAKAVIVDEMSMVDIFLMRSLLTAVRPGTKLILVGDADQLPSVGAGNVLRDIIDSGAIPVVRLNEIFRQGHESAIITNAHRINRGQYPVIRNRDTDFFLERKDSAAAAASATVALVEKRLPKYLGVDSLRGIQVMAPMKRGALGVLRLNAVLQASLNPPARSKGELTRGETAFRLGDKVMQIRNDYDIEWERGEESGTGVFNGDIGYIDALDSEERTLSVSFDDGRRAVYDDGMLDELELSYCISVHKSQGSEFEAVVLPLLGGSSMLLTRNLLYTAVTRARKLVVIVGREECVRMMVDNNRITKRYSALATRLKAFCGK